MATTSYSPDSQLTTGMIIRRVLFIALTLGLALYHLFLNFRGLSHEQGIDQAQIAREVGRGNGFATKFIRPASLSQVNSYREDAGLDNPEASLWGFQDIYHAPLNPLLNSVFLRAFKGKWAFETANPEDDSVYFLDRVIAAVSMLMLFGAMGVTYLLVGRIFDGKIAGVTVLLMGLCSLMWDMSQSGLPQMLMLFLASFAFYFLYRAVEAQQEEALPTVWLALAAGFLGLLALSHWITVWVFLGVLVFSALYFRPRGMMAVVLLGVFAVVVAAWGWRNYKVCGNVLGSGIFLLKAGLAEGSESVIFRNFTPGAQFFETTGLFSKLMVNSLIQIEDLYSLLGAIVVAPLFFLSLLHPFKRREIADFRWCLLAMWIAAVIGMTIYGLPQKEMDANQLHILFAPLMAAYGLAFLTVVWNRIGFETMNPLVTQGHFIIVCILSAIPLLLPMPRNIRADLTRDKRFRANWPPYYPPSLALLGTFTDEKEVLVSDLPWAVAWYTDRPSLWLPRDIQQFNDLRGYSAERGTPFAGLLLTPVTLDGRISSGIFDGEYAPWKEVILYPQGANLNLDTLREVPTFPFTQSTPVLGDLMYLFSDTPRWAER